MTNTILSTFYVAPVFHDQEEVYRPSCIYSQMYCIMADKFFLSASDIHNLRNEGYEILIKD